MTVRIGVVGAGHMAADYHCPSLSCLAGGAGRRVRLEAVCDPVEERARGLGERFGFRKVFFSVGEMLSRASLDGVCVITSVKATAEVASEVMRAGVPVFMEKPPGASPAEAARLARAARRTERPSRSAPAPPGAGGPRPSKFAFRMTARWGRSRSGWRKPWETGDSR